MKLELVTLPVAQLELGAQTTYKSGRMTVSADSLRSELLQDRRLATVQVEVVRPGDPVRIIHAMDVVEPRVKLSGRGEIFPGFFGQPTTVGSGKTLRLSGMSVITSGLPPGAAFDTVVSISEGIIDMSGPAAALSPFSDLQNLVLLCTPVQGTTGLEFAKAMRLAALKAARSLAAAAAGSSPIPAGRLYSLGAPARSDLPRIAVISQLARTGDLYNTFLYGRSVEGIAPTLLHPNEYMDGAVVSGNYRYACQRNPTYFYQNNPVVQDLYDRHGSELNLVGTVVCRGHANLLEEKHMAAEYCAKLAQHLRADGVVITAEGGGHAMMELMLTCQSCEQIGIRTSLIMAEMSGPDGSDNPFVDFVPGADLVVSVGNQEERILLPAMERVIGGTEILESGQDPYGPLWVPTRHLYCSTCQLGSSRVSTRAS